MCVCSEEKRERARAGIRVKSDGVRKNLKFLRSVGRRALSDAGWACSRAAAIVALLSAATAIAIAAAGQLCRERQELLLLLRERESERAS